MQNVIGNDVEGCAEPKGYRGRPRNLEVVMTGAHGFEVRDADDSSIGEKIRSILCFFFGMTVCSTLISLRYAMCTYISSFVIFVIFGETPFSGTP